MLRKSLPLSGMALSLTVLLADVAAEETNPKSRFSYTVSGAVSGSDSGALVGIFGIPSRLASEDNLKNRKGMCYIHFVLDGHELIGLKEAGNKNLTFALQAAIRGPLRRGTYLIGTHKIVPNRVYANPDPWAAPLRQPGAVFARLQSGLSADMDEQPDHWLSQSGVFRVDRLTGNQVEASFEINLIEERNEFLTEEYKRLPRRTTTVRGNFTHPLNVSGQKKSSFLDRWLCSQSAVPLYVHYFKRLNRLPEIKENPVCVRARARLWSDRLYRKAYAEQKWIEYARKERIYDSDVYNSLVYREACLLANVDSAKRGIGTIEDCGTIQEAREKTGTAESLMTTDSETGEIDTKDALADNQIRDVVWESAYGHEKKHGRQIKEYNACIKSAACLRNLEEKYPQASKFEKNSDMYEKRAWFTSQQEIEAYDVSINMLEEWIKNRCRTR